MDGEGGFAKIILKESPPKLFRCGTEEGVFSITCHFKSAHDILCTHNQSSPKYWHRNGRGVGGGEYGGI